MKPFEEQFTAWVDGELSGPELVAFEKELAQHPEASGDKSDALRLRALLREKSTAPQLSNADFFNLQIMHRVAGEAPPRAPARSREPSLFWSLPRLAWAGAFCLLMAFALFKAMIPTGASAQVKSSYFAQVVEAWPADPSISATTVYNAKDNVTVVWLDGLDYIPATYALK